MKLFQKEGLSGKNIPLLLLLAAGIMEFLMITLERRFSSVAYYLTETYLIVPCLLFLGCILRDEMTTFARRRFLLSLAAVAWFVAVQIQHRLSGMENHPMVTVFFVYLMAFPFASSTEDRNDTGIRWIGMLLVSASLVLAGYSLLLVLDWVPEGMQEVLYWDGARLHALWHPNISACYFMIGIGFCAAFCARVEKSWGKAALLAAVAVQFLAMSLTNCRTMLLMTGALFGGIAFFRIFRGGWKRLIPGLLAAAVLFAGSFKLSDGVFRWNNDRLVAALHSAQEETAVHSPVQEASAVEAVLTEDPATGQNVMTAEDAFVETVPAVDDTGVISGDNPQGTLANDLRTLNGRTIIWRSALKAVRDNRTLALWGTEYSGTVVSVYNPFEVVHGHNSWMEALLRLGIPGLLLSLAFTVVSLRSAVGLLLSRNTDMWKKTIAMTTLCVMVAGFLEPYLFITNVYYHIPDFVFFFCTGYLDFWHKQNRKTA